MMKAKLLLAFCLCLTVSACGWMGAEDSATQKANDVSTLPDKEQLAIRIQQRWDAMIDLDMAAVYAFATPTYRASYDLKHLSGQYGSQIKRKSIDIESIDIRPDNSTANVVVNLHFVTEGFGTGNIELTDRVKETWVKRDGQWWHVEPR